MSRATGVPVFLADVIQGTALHRHAGGAAVHRLPHPARRSARMSDVLDQILQVGFLAAMHAHRDAAASSPRSARCSPSAPACSISASKASCCSAMTGFTAAYFSGDLWIGVLPRPRDRRGLRLAACACSPWRSASASMSPASASRCFATGLAYFLYRLIFGQQAVPPNIDGFTTLPIPLLSDIPVLGPVALQPVRAGLHRDPGRAACRLRALPHALGPGAAHGRREPARRRSRPASA